MQRHTTILIITLMLGIYKILHQVTIDDTIDENPVKVAWEVVN